MVKRDLPGRQGRNTGDDWVAFASALRSEIEEARDLGMPIVLRLREHPDPATVRLMESLGVDIVIEPE